jgi:hypothetical protein
MPYQIGPHNAYLMNHAHKRMSRERNRADIREGRGDPITCIAIVLSDDMRAPWGATFDWSDVIDWFDDLGILIFTWSSYTGEWNRDFVLNRPFTDRDRVEFALRFS